ncbi:hypothetical protein H6G97_30430 [Nostoc flagelliforme FACHB-838]|uniref:Uncharacterized protein n=1 Tax=Nostoc flagelliforme FACHB-838 TaxID=2692904 RepID=A0ABR8DXN6_9NOSO|nr:hypothetical protein [Nostoc flagelliforme FACHB-838]
MTYKTHVIPFHVNSDTDESCRDAKFRVSTGLYLYQGFCETVSVLSFQRQN